MGYYWRLAHLEISETPVLLGTVKPKRIRTRFLEGGCAHMLWSPADDKSAHNASELAALREKMLEGMIDDDETASSSDHDDVNDDDLTENHDDYNDGSCDADTDHDSHDDDDNAENGATDARPMPRQARVFSLQIPEHLGGGEIIVYKSGEIYAQCPIHGRRCRKSGKGILPSLEACAVLCWSI